MKLNTIDAPPNVIDGSIRIGEVHPFRGGKHAGARFRVVVGVDEHTIHFLHFDRDGEVCGSSSYARHCLEGRDPIGMVTNLPQALNVDWGRQA